MKWLQWSTIDLENGLGGVEVNARSIARELRHLGVDAQFSRDPADLKDPKWDVIHTHGSMIPITPLKTKALRIHALHGTTIGRMAACGEWSWPGGYYAAAREMVGVSEADIILADHTELWLYRLAEKMGKTVAAISNGWDPSDFLDSSHSHHSSALEALPTLVQDILQSQTPYVLYLGRGADPVKAVDRLIDAMELLPDVKLIAVPGQGFEEAKSVVRTDRLEHAQIQVLLDQARALALTSKYEGLPLVVMEALGAGLPVVTTRAGGLKTLPLTLHGLEFVEGRAEDIAEGIQKVLTLDHSTEARGERARANRQLLSSWRDVAQKALDTVQLHLKTRSVPAAE